MTGIYLNMGRENSIDGAKHPFYGEDDPITAKTFKAPDSFLFHSCAS